MKTFFTLFVCFFSVTVIAQGDCAKTFTKAIDKQDYKTASNAGENCKEVLKDEELKELLAASFIHTSEFENDVPST